MRKLTGGEPMGCTDTAGPQSYTPAQLSRLHDAMVAAEEAGLDPKAVFRLAPSTMMAEYNYSRWRYQA